MCLGTPWGVNAPGGLGEGSVPSRGSAGATPCPQRATNDLDQVPVPEMGSEGFVHRHGHRGLLTLQPPAQPPPSSTTKQAFRPPHSVPMLARGGTGGPHPKIK